MYPHLNESGHGHVETVSSVLGNLNPSNADLAGSDVGSHAVERQKLSLKPRSQPPEQLEENIQRGRSVMFSETFFTCIIYFFYYKVMNRDKS